MTTTEQENEAQFPQGTFNLDRVPENRQLRAWDAADELLLNELHNRGIPHKDQSVLILNDNFGAISVALSSFNCSEWNDSHLAQLASEKNYHINGLDSSKRSLNQSIDLVDGVFDIVVMKLPKNSDLLEHQLYQLRANLSPQTVFIAADMNKHIHSSTLKLIEKIIGPTTTSLAKKKARLVFIERDPNLTKGHSRWPNSYSLEVDREYKIFNHANVFCNNHLDHGTRLLLEVMPVSNEYEKIADLGCGNGILGLVASSLNSKAEVSFFDESKMAIESARLNVRENCSNEFSAVTNFTVADGLGGTKNQTFDLILINPPFHQQYAIGDSIAWQMFMQSRNALKSGGEVRIVGNRHLGYFSKLKKIFGNCEMVISNKKFSVFSSIKK